MQADLQPSALGSSLWGSREQTWGIHGTAIIHTNHVTVLWLHVVLVFSCSFSRYIMESDSCQGKFHSFKSDIFSSCCFENWSFDMSPVTKDNGKSDWQILLFVGNKTSGSEYRRDSKAIVSIQILEFFICIFFVWHTMIAHKNMVPYCRKTCFVDNKHNLQDCKLSTFSMKTYWFVVASNPKLTSRWWHHQHYFLRHRRHYKTIECESSISKYYVGQKNR